MMAQMVPRMWQYQVEFPPRTVAHLLLGFLIGVLLLLKIAILRFFRYYEEWMPFLGTALFVCTVLLLALSLPTVAREGALANSAIGGRVDSPQNCKRVAALLPSAGFAPGTVLEPLSTPTALRAGRNVLLDQCVRCHDLKTILSQPRTPSDWLGTIRRMAGKPALFAPITEQDQGRVCAYLIAITPDLPRSNVPQQPAKLPRQVHDGLGEESRGTDVEARMTPRAARATFQRVCAQCHSLSDVDKSPPRTVAGVQTLMQRMTRNGMRASPDEVRLLQFHLTRTFVKTP